MMYLMNSLLFCIGALIVSIVLVRYKKLALFICCLIPLSYMISDPTYTWLGESKRWAISLPVVYFSIVMYMVGKTKKLDNLWYGGLLSLTIFVNVLLLNPAEFSQGGIFNRVNAIILLGLAFLVPHNWQYNQQSQTIGFQNTAWVALYTSALALFFLHNPIASEIMPVAVSSLLIPLIPCIWYKSTEPWFAYRAYSLNCLIVARAFVPELVLTEPVKIIIPTGIVLPWTVFNLLLLGVALGTINNSFYKAKNHRNSL